MPRWQDRGKDPAADRIDPKGVLAPGLSAKAVQLLYGRMVRPEKRCPDGRVYVYRHGSLWRVR